MIQGISRNQGMLEHLGKEVAIRRCCKACIARGGGGHFNGVRFRVQYKGERGTAYRRLRPKP